MELSDGSNEPGLLAFDPNLSGIGQDRRGRDLDPEAVSQ
jgi:hypothetical protein